MDTLAERIASKLNALLPSPPKTIAIAVSGGADSMALTLLASQWADANNCECHALTVDHQLRAASSDEAEQVKKWMAHHAITHHTLAWETPTISGNMQENARQARYTLMQEYCTAHNIQHLLIAHHQEDQAETFLMRLSRGSGVDGLAAMHAKSKRQNLVLLRPLLDTPKIELVRYLQEIGQAWLEDPSNQNPDFLRVRMRQAQPTLDTLGLTPARMAGTAENLQRAQSALQYYTKELLAQAIAHIDHDSMELNHQIFFCAPEEIQLRALSMLLSQHSTNTHPPRMEKLTRLLGAISQGQPHTLYGFLFRPGHTTTRIQREATPL